MMVPLFVLAWLLVPGASFELGATPPQPATASSQAASKPSHPILTERFEFHEKLGDLTKLHRGQKVQSPAQKAWNANDKAFHGLPTIPDHTVILPHANRFGALMRAFSSLSLTDMLDALGDNGPKGEVLQSKYTFDESPLGRGSFGEAWKATDKKTGEVVVVKVILLTGVTTYAEALAAGKGTLDMLDLSSEECQTAKDIQSQDTTGKDKDSKLVVKCLEDGIALAKEDHSRPLYVTLAYAGSSTLNAWAKENLDKRGAEIPKQTARLRKLISELMRSLKYMTKEDHAVKFIHHDLKPENVAVATEEDPADMTLIDLGTALRSDNPDGVAHCTPIFRPPETGTTRQEEGQVGMVQPWHSYDTYGAAASISAMVAGEEAAGGTLLPGLQMRALSEGQANALTPRLLPAVAECVNAESAANTEANVLALFGQCLGSTPMQIVMKNVETVLKPALAGVESNPLNFYKALSCVPPVVSGTPNAPGTTYVPAKLGDRQDTWERIMTEWYDTGFAAVLASMMHPDPAKRPTPEQVLENEWLQPGYLCSSGAESWCLSPDKEPSKEFEAGATGSAYRSKLQDSCTSIVVPPEAWRRSAFALGLMSIFLPLACCLCCCGFCPHPFDFKFLAVAASCLLVCSEPAASLWVETGTGAVFLLWVSAIGLMGAMIYTSFCGPPKFFGHVAVAVALHAFVLFIYINVLLHSSFSFLNSLATASPPPSTGDQAIDAAMQGAMQLAEQAPAFKLFLYICVMVPGTQFLITGVMAFKAYQSHGFLGMGGNPDIMNPTEMAPSSQVVYAGQMAPQQAQVQFARPATELSNVGP